MSDPTPSPAAWRALVAAGLGWALDAMDVMLYAFALQDIGKEFGLDGATKGALAAVTLLAAAVGGAVFGILSDRYGRARMLVVSILVYSTFTALTATAGSVGELVLWRLLVGIGLGGEWSAGSVLVAETWPARHRGKAIGWMQAGWAVGTMLAALLSAFVLPRWGWRPLFALGLLPALLVLWIRRNLPEPPAWRPRERGDGGPGLRLLLVPPLRGRALRATGMAACLLFAYWGLFTWIPAYLAAPIEKGGAGLGIVKSVAWIAPMQAGAFAGYVTFGMFSDRFGRKPTFVVYVLAAAVVAPLYGMLPRSEVALMVLGPLVGFFGHGYFSVFGALLAEMFPSSIRGAAQGICYNLGRAASAAAPIAIGALADVHGIGTALGLVSLFYAAGAFFVRGLPETRGRELG